MLHNAAKASKHETQQHDETSLNETFLVPFGCHIGVTKVITGGELGKSEGKSNLQEKKPPEK